MKKKLKFIFISLGGIALILVIMFQSGTFATGKIDPGNSQLTPPIPNTTQLLTIKKQDIPLLYHAVGTIHSRTEIDLSSRITARVLEVKARSGDKVKKGEILFELDKTDLNAMLTRAKENLNATKAAIKAANQEINKAKSTFNLAKSNLKRDTILFEKKIIPKKLIESTTSRYEQSESALNESEQNKMRNIAAAEAAQASVKEASAKLAYASIRSPFDGIVAEQLADPGDMASPGIILMTIFDPTRIMFYVPISESLVNLIKVGERLPINIQAVKKNVDGEIREIVPSVDPGSRTFLVKICILKDNHLMPGMFGTLNLKTGTQKVILIPDTAIIKIGQLEYVNVVKNAKSIKQLVRSVKYDKNQSEIISGLQVGDTIELP